METRSDGNIGLNPFLALANVPVLYPLKTTEKLRFCSYENIGRAWVKGTVMQIIKALINDRLRISKVS